ncbi:LacI family DNA-binding transcriptional regulator [Streptomyces tardus]|uniref:LacI family DNA-binding transcriptional regulator n=1 Tax=Streptomyces tardus TaxID=2780544 RepID=UPI0027E3F667|nr:LacI family DNA-binding transcriptional regulator [Streptomyces tardus]
MTAPGAARHTRRPTLEEVAARAGVGRGTASRVVNGSPTVSAHSRAAVEAAVEELGYVPNGSARALAAGSTDSIALVVPESETRLFAEPYFSGTVSGVATALADTEKQLLLTLLRTPKERERFARYVRARRIDGVLLVSMHAGDPLPELLQQYEMPTVLGGRRSADEQVPYVDCDNPGGAEAAVAHLLARGRRRIATVTGSLDLYAAQCRLEGYRAALRHGDHPADPRLVAQGDFTEEGGRRAMGELLERCPQLDAVFCASDLMASGARLALREAGRRVPDDVALVGFDDSAVARHLDPPLTSVRQPVELMGREMTGLLLDQIAGRTGESEARRRLLPTELVPRGSS